MRRILFLVLCAVLMANITFAVEKHPFSVNDLLAMDRIADPRVSPDGKQVAFVLSITDLDKNKRRSDIYLISTEGGPLRRLTTHEAGDSQPRWSPDGKTLYFVSTRSGSAQVWRIALDGGEAEQVTKLPLDVDALEIAPKGQFLVVGMGVIPGKTPAETAKILDEKSNAKATGKIYDRLFVRHWDTWGDGTRNHVFIVPIGGGEPRDVMLGMDADSPTKPFGGSEDYAISPDGKVVVFSAKDVGREEAWSTNYDLFQAPTDGSADPKRITTNPAWDAQPRFSPDGKYLAYLAMKRAGYEADRYDVVIRELATGKENKFTLRVDDTPRGDRSVGEICWSPDGKELYLGADNLGQHALFAMDVTTGKSRLIVDQGTIVAPQPQGDGRILFGKHTLTSPTELFSVSRDGKDERKISGVNDARLAAINFGKPEQFTFTGAKGDKVYGYIVHPINFDPAKKYPVAFIIHGGPQGSMGNDFHYRWNPQFYVGAGYAAVMIDFHASTGYGQAFTDGVNGDWGGAPFEDLMKGLDFALQKYPFLDNQRMGALGASYGGYMINWVAGQTDRFKALVCHDGNLDERMAYFDTEELWFPEWEHGGLPWTPNNTYNKHNPIDYVKNWKTPTLVIHGALDYRVVDTQGISTFTALQRRGIPSKFLYFPDENHWVLKPANSILWHQTVLAWLDQWVKK